MSPDQDCDVFHLLAAVTYWCQGKPNGCELTSELLRSVVSCPHMARVSIQWHYEQDYNNIEIPCPTYQRGPFTKKFSKISILRGREDNFLTLFQSRWRTPVS